MRIRAAAGLLTCFLGATEPALAQLPYLVKDLNTDARGAYGSSPFNFVSAGDRAYFATESYLETGYSIWTTDGSEEGTRQIATFPGCRPSWNGRGPILAPLGDLVFYSEWCLGDEWRQRLWRTDGSTVGTFPLTGNLAEVHTGVGYSIQEDSWTRTLNGRLFFAARTAAESDLELWSSDGTAEGTARLAALPSPAGSWLSFSARAGDRLLLFIQQNTYGFLTDIWSTDGTAAGTLELASLKLGAAPAVTAGRTVVFFEASAPDGPEPFTAQLWATDGTPSGTRPLTHFSAAESDIGCWSQPRIVGDELLFCAYTLESGFEIWRSDGTVAGTFPVSAFANSSPFADYAYRVEATRYAGAYYFLGYDDEYIFSLWRSSGTPGAAVRVRTLAEPGAYLYGEHWIEQAGGRLVFWGFDDGWKLYGSDGTAAGTTELAETCPDSCGTFVSGARAFGDRLLFFVQDEVGREQLWSTQGSPATTFPLAAEEESVAGESPLTGAALAGSWLFPARDAATGFEPWLADPARARSARRIRDLVLDLPGIRLANPRVRGSELAFSTREDFHYGDFGVYRTDGTAAGTLEIARTATCSCGMACSTGPAAAYPVRAGILFDDPEDCESYSIRSWNRSSGEVSRLFGGPDGERPGEPEHFLLGDEALVFLHHNGTSTEIWRTDGTEAGSRLALAASPEVRKRPFIALGSGLLLLSIESNLGLSYFDPEEGTAVDLPSYTSDAWPQSPTVVGTSAYFFADPYPDPTEIWRSDGTEAGTVLLLRLPAERQLASSFFDLDGSALFALHNWETGLELWTSDGTPSGTLRLRTFADGQYGMADLGRIGHRALFGVHTFDSSTGIYRSELWQTDGTGEGTQFLMDLERDGRPEYIQQFVESASALLFETTNDDYAVTLWTTDGTPGGTRVLWSDATINYDWWWESIQPTPFGSEIVFVGETLAHGRELRVMEATAVGSRLLVDLRPGPESSSPRDLIVATDRLYFTADDGIHGRELWVILAAGAEPCVPSATVLCLLDGRYRLELASVRGAARALPLTATTGGFALADGDEPDAFVKLIDGLAVNRNHWLFGAGLLPHAFTLRVTDTTDGRSKLWTTPTGDLASFGDIDAFPALPTGPFSSGAQPASGESRSGDCGEAGNRLSFEDGRYLVEAIALGWNGAAIPACASALDLGPREGAFWLFDAVALELVVRLEREPVSGRVVLAVAALTNLGYEVRILDSFTGRLATMEGPAGTFHSQEIADLFPAL